MKKLLTGGFLFGMAGAAFAQPAGNMETTKKLASYSDICMSPETGDVDGKRIGFLRDDRAGKDYAYFQYYKEAADYAVPLDKGIGDLGKKQVLAFTWKIREGGNGSFQGMVTPQVITGMLVQTFANGVVSRKKVELKREKENVRGYKVCAGRPN